MDKKQLDTLRQKNPFLPLNEIVYELLLQEIISFRLAPGSKISESMIAAALDISRSPVRQALSRLLKNAYVIKNPSYRVAAFSMQEYDDVSELSDLIEPYAAGRAVQWMTDAELAELYKFAEKMHAICSGDVAQRSEYWCVEITKLEYLFHSQVVHLARHPLLEEFYQQIKYRLYRYRSYLNYDPPSGYFDIVANEHLFVCDTLKLRDKVMAEAVMHRHLGLAREEFKKKFLLHGALRHRKDTLFST